MHLFLGTKTKVAAGSDVIINCPCCNRHGVGAHTCQQTEWLTLFHLIPFLKISTTFVRCVVCRQDMIAKCSLDDLQRADPMTLQRLMVRRTSLVGKVCIMMGVLFCWTPVAGLILAGIGWFYRNDYGSWMKKMSFVGLILSVLLTLLGLVCFLVSKPWLDN